MLCCAVSCCGVLWRAVLWCGVVWRAVLWCGVVWCGVFCWWCGDVVVLVVCSVQLVSLRVAEVEQFCQVKRMIGGIVNKTREDEREERKRERKKKKKREKETGERERHPVCAFNTSPCVRSKCPRVYRQHAHMFFFHVGMLPVHTGTF